MDALYGVLLSRIVTTLDSLGTRGKIKFVSDAKNKIITITITIAGKVT